MRRVLVLLAVVLASLALNVTPARADYGTVTTVVLANDTNFYPTNMTAIVLRTVTLAAGEYRHVKTRLEATSSTTDTVAMDNIVQCATVNGTVVGVSSGSSRNHEGYDTTSYALDGHLPIYADLLFRAPSAGTYTCKLVGWTNSSHGTGYHLTAVAGSTWLQISDVNQVGANWWQNPVCTSAGTSATCTYLGAGNNSSLVFYNDGTGVFKWNANSGATSVTALANLDLTTCYKNSESCQNTSISSYQKAFGTNSVVDVRLEFIQLDPTAHTCRNTSTATMRKTIGDSAHHYVINLSLPSVPVDFSCGTLQYIMRIYVAYVSGNPIKIDGTQGESLTNGIAMNNFG